MNNKKILLAVFPDSLDASMFDFFFRNIEGKNLDVTICQISSEKYDFDSCEVLMGFMAICNQRLIPFKTKSIERDWKEKLKSEMAFSDVLILQKEVLEALDLEKEFDTNACPTILVPSEFSRISNIILALDGTRKSLYAIKQFFQIFSDKMNDLNMTLLDISGVAKSQISIEEESMLIGYLKLYNSNLAVLKVKHPISENHMVSLGVDEGTFVVGSIDFLLSQKGELSPFNPFYDLRTAVFMPALYE